MVFNRSAKIGPSSNPEQKREEPGGDIGFFESILIALSYLLVVLTFPFSYLACFGVAKEYERTVLYRLGRLIPGNPKGPGLFFWMPWIDELKPVDLRTVTFEVPPQEVLTRDSVTVTVDAVVYYKVQDALASVNNVENAALSTQLLAQSTLRNVLGTKSLSEILSDREHISHTMQTSLDEATDPWGIKVERVEVKNVRLPEQLQRAMAAEAEASREARAKVIAAEGEQKASKALKEAADIIATSPGALQLRYLQTLVSVADKDNHTVLFPLPIELMKALIKK